jgi:chromatin segregation and condensation protein Rec8/ScpA/Scc1 (kleisin family)
VTIFDLKRALTAAMKVSFRRNKRHSERVFEEEEDGLFDDFELGGPDFSQRLHSLFTKIKNLLSGRRVLSFFRLLERGDKDERVSYFFEVLHLMAQGEITCEQEEFLGDIIIMLPQGAEQGAG